MCMCRNNKQDQTKNLSLFRNLGEQKASDKNHVKNGRKRINYKKKRKFHAKFDGEQDTYPGAHMGQRKVDTTGKQRDNR